MLLLAADVFADEPLVPPAPPTVLHDIVTHIYLAGDAEERTAHGFLGARLEPPEAGVFEGQDVSGGAGVFIYECMPGFCGYRWLRPGDIVSGVTLEAEMLRITAREQLIAAVSALPPATPLRLRVLRQGRELEVSVRLDARP